MIRETVLYLIQSSKSSVIETHHEAGEMPEIFPQNVIAQHHERLPAFSQSDSFLDSRQDEF